jgi:ankyrin repeat protein
MSERRDPNAQLWDAAQQGLSDRVRQVLGQGMCSHDGEVKAILVAAANDHVAALAILLHEASDTAREAVSPLIEAARNGSTDVIAFLTGTELPNDGNAALGNALWAGQDAAINQLLKAKADVNGVTTFGDTLLGYSVTIRAEDAVQRMLQIKADVNREDVRGFTPLGHATRMYSAGMVQILVGAKADTNHRSIPRTNAPP